MPASPPLPLHGTEGEPARARLRERVRGRPLLVLLDVDGTLAPIVARPEDAAVPEATRAALLRLVARPDTHVALVSGRAADDARRVAGIGGVWAVGNHGAETMRPDGSRTVDPEVAPHQEAMARARRSLEASLAPLPGVLVEDKRFSLSVHYRRADPAVAPRLRAVVDGVGERYGLRRTEGKMVLELRAPVEVHKGTASLALARSLGALEPGASLVFVGDDATDEDAMRTLRAQAPHAVTVRVAESAEVPTAAEFVVTNPDAVRDLLEWLAGVS